MKKTIQLLTLGIALLPLITGFAQQDPQYSLYMFNTVLINPAYAGSLESASVSALYRKQWINVKGSPQTINASFHTPLWKERVGIGVSFFNDQLGITGRNDITLSYSYHIPFKKFKMSIGLQTTIVNLNSRLAESQLDPNQTYDPTFANNISNYNFNFGAGIYFYNRKFYAGISVPHILLNEWGNLATDSARGILRQHFFFTGGAIIKISPIVKLKPSTVIKYVIGAPINFDVNANIYFKDRYGFGIGYRSLDALILIAEIDIIRGFRCGYAFDLSLTNLGSYNYGTHEIMLRYDFNWKKNKLVSPRFF
jgi:type IX secretion system PorP/SprF family membrane protein